MAINNPPISVLHFLAAPAAGGAEVYVKDLAKAFVREGGIATIGFLETSEESGRSLEFEKKFLADLDASGVNYFFVGSKARTQPWLGILKVYKYTRDYKIDIYHSHLTYGVIFGCLLSVPRLYTHHNIAPRVNKYVYKALCFFIDKQIGISTLCGQMLESFSNRNVTIINNGVDIDKFNAPTVRGWKENGIIDCLCVGAITEQKNYSYLIRVIQLLPLDIRKRLNIVIAGEGTEENTLKIRAEIISADLEHNIRLLGNRTDIVDIMSSVQVFIMSSAWEGLPIALIEATMSGLPCIVTDVGGCKEVIECCKNGIVVDPLDHVEFRDAISYMVTDSSAIKKFSESALYNRHRYSIISSCKKHLDVYNNMLSNYSDD